MICCVWSNRYISITNAGNKLLKQFCFQSQTEQMAPQHYFVRDFTRCIQVDDWSFCTANVLLSLSSPWRHCSKHKTHIRCKFIHNVSSGQSIICCVEWIVSVCLSELRWIFSSVHTDLSSDLKVWQKNEKRKKHWVISTKSRSFTCF